MTLDNRTKELVAIGASITANCQPCLQYHVSKAREYEVKEQEIAEAMDVGRLVRRGAAFKMDRLALTFTEATPADATAPTGNCGCG